MKNVIYIDVLIVLNIIVTFLLLSATSRLLKLSPHWWRYLLGSLLGGLFSLIIFAPDVGFILSVVTKLLISLLIVIAVYNPRSIRTIVRQTAYFFVVSFIFAGMMMCFASLPGVEIVQYRNGAAYINLSFTSLTGGCIVCYVVTCVLAKITKYRLSGNIYSEIYISYKGKAINAQAMLDTGNSLTDPFTGESVIIADVFTLGDVLPENIRSYFGKDKDITGIKLIPCRTVSAQTLLPCFRADYIKINCEKSSCEFRNVQIAVTDKRLDCVILPPTLTENSERRKDDVKTQLQLHSTCEKSHNRYKDKTVCR